MVEEYACKMCTRLLDESAYRWRRNVKGYVYRCGKCLDCQAIKDNVRYIKQRPAWLKRSRAYKAAHKAEASLANAVWYQRTKVRRKQRVWQKVMEG